MYKVKAVELNQWLKSLELLVEALQITNAKDLKALKNGMRSVEEINNYINTNKDGSL